MNAGDTKAAKPQSANGHASPEPKNNPSKKVLLASAAIPLGRAFGVRIYLSVYNVLWIVLLGYESKKNWGCWAGRIALIAYALTFPLVFLIAGLVECSVSKKFRAEPSALAVFPGFVMIWYRNLKLPRKALAITVMSWPLVMLGFLILWIILTVLSMDTQDTFDKYPPEDCISWNDSLALFSIIHALTTWNSILLTLLPVWPGPCFSASCLLVSKFGVSKRATFLMMGALSIGICTALITVGTVFSGHSDWVKMLVGAVGYFVFLLVINVLVMGYRLLSNDDGESWEPFSDLAEELVDLGPAVDHMPLANPRPP